MTPDPSRTALVRRARRINRELALLYPDAHTELNFTSPLELLVATILSAQTTDKGVNLVTPVLFARYRSAADYAAADRAEMEKIIQSTGFFRAKTNSLIGLGQALCDRYAGRCRRKLADLVTLPGSAGRRPTSSSATRSACPASPWTRTSPGWPGASGGRTDRPGQDRAGGRGALPAVGVDHPVAPADLARQARLPRPQARLRSLRASPGCARPTGKARLTRRRPARW